MVNAYEVLCFRSSIGLRMEFCRLAGPQDLWRMFNRQTQVVSWKHQMAFNSQKNQRVTPSGRGVPYFKKDLNISKGLHWARELCFSLRLREDLLSRNMEEWSPEEIKGVPRGRHLARNGQQMSSSEPAATGKWVSKRAQVLTSKQEKKANHMMRNTSLRVWGNSSALRICQSFWLSLECKYVDLLTSFFSFPDQGPRDLPATPFFPR